ncbi:O-antigen acetylase [plant metagenome]|uniref:O-antigen acetylase n=1 Tax=plant metagenome TaxID=1297885 RepID=A0A484QNP0_9ZZZZ
MPSFQMHNKNLRYRPDIDGLRAIAVSVVVLFHAFPALLPGGFIGVDIFFVISGYLISSILYKSMEAGTFSLADFYARRVKRIFPALLLVLVSSLVAGWFLLFPDEYKELGKHVAGGAAFVSNLVLWNEAGYFDVTAEKKPLLHLWSLGIEEQFYFFWPLALWLAWKLRLNFLLLAVAAMAVSFFLNIQNIGTDPVSVFYLPQMRMWELLIGASIAYLQWRGRRLPMPALAMAASNLLSVAGAALIAYGLYTITKETPFPGTAAVAPAMGAALLIACGPNAYLNRWILSSRLFVWIGLISYPLYLWHWPLLSFAHIIIGEALPLRVAQLAVGVSVVLAILTYFLVEKPLRHAEFRWIVPGLAGVMLLLGIAGYDIFKKDGLTERALIKESALRNSQFVGPLWKYTKNDTCLKRYPFPEASDYGWWFCVASKDAPPTLLLLGSSFANHHYAGFLTVKPFSDESILSIGACPVDVRYITDPEAPKTYSPCSGDRAHKQRLLIDGVIEASAGTLRLVVIDGLSQAQNSATIQAVQERLDFLLGHGAKVVIFKPHLTRDGDLKGCFARPLKTPQQSCELPLGARKELDAKFQPLVDALAASHPDIPFFDQNDMLCDGDRCSLIVDGMPAFRDEYSHYSEYASEVLVKRFAEWAAERGLPLQ